MACASPFNRLMSNTFAEDFVCSRPAKPVITWRRLSSREYLVDCSRYVRSSCCTTLQHHPCSSDPHIVGDCRSRADDDSFHNILLRNAGMKTHKSTRRSLPGLFSQALYCDGLFRSNDLITE